MNYIIKSEGVYWNNNDGWVDRPSATVFSKEERGKLNLPIAGDWVSLEDDRTFQDRCIDAACLKWQQDELQIDEDARVSETGDGKTAWVQAWVLIAIPTTGEQA